MTIGKWVVKKQYKLYDAPLLLKKTYLYEKKIEKHFVDPNLKQFLKCLWFYFIIFESILILLTEMTAFLVIPALELLM